MCVCVCVWKALSHTLSLHHLFLKHTIFLSPLTQISEEEVRSMQTELGPFVGGQAAVGGVYFQVRRSQTFCFKKQNNNNKKKRSEFSFLIIV